MALFFAVCTVASAATLEHAAEASHASRLMRAEGEIRSESHLNGKRLGVEEDVMASDLLEAEQDEKANVNSHGNIIHLAKKGINRASLGSSSCDACFQCDPAEEVGASCWCRTQTELGNMDKWPGAPDSDATCSSKCVVQTNAPSNCGDMNCVCDNYLNYCQGTWEPNDVPAGENGAALECKTGRVARKVEAQD